jgi:type II secretory pathway component PulC
MKSFVIFLLFAVSLRGADNTYSSITKRNAFELTSEKPIAILPPVSEILAPSIFLTGITRWKGTNKVHLVLRKAGENDKFVSLGKNERQYNIELKKVLEGSVLIEANGSNKLLSFKTNSLPTIVTKAPAPKKTSSSSRYSRDKKEVKKEEKKSSPPSIKAQVVTVPSRRSQVDPRIIEKGLEYLSRMEEGEKRDYLLKRMESLQSGQRQIKSDIDQNERRRQYDEYRSRQK